jgi:hypothetical protein
MGEIIPLSKTSIDLHSDIGRAFKMRACGVPGPAWVPEDPRGPTSA